MPNPKYQGPDGKFFPGNPGGPGRKKGERYLTDVIWKVLREEAVGDELTAAYEAMNIPQGIQNQIDMAEDRLEALARFMVYKTLVGLSMEPVLQRIAPIPREIELSGKGGRPIRTVGASTVMASQVSADTAEAAYLALLRGEVLPDAEAADDQSADDDW